MSLFLPHFTSLDVMACWRIDVSDVSAMLLHLPRLLASSLPSLHPVLKSRGDQDVVDRGSPAPLSVCAARFAWGASESPEGEAHN
jgi:hypothetical protein